LEAVRVDLRDLLQVDRGDGRLREYGRTNCTREALILSRETRWLHASGMRLAPFGERKACPMASDWYTIVIDAHDPPALARFWADVLGYRVVFEDVEEVVIAKAGDAYPGISFVPGEEQKTVKNRLHIDLNPEDQYAEVSRLLALGAKRVNIGQGNVTWVVLSDPEGNEFCVLRRHEDLVN
jgi:predicted enzyme related to lactoylglutathione lyase